MASNTRKDALIRYTSDMHALVTHGVQALGRQIENLKDANHPEAHAAVQDFHRTLQAHASILEARVEALGGSATQPLKEAVSRVAGLVAGLVNAVRGEEASKSLRDDYTYLSHVAIGYMMLDTTAAGLSDRETRAIAETGYRDAARMVVHVDRIMPTVVLQELRQDGLTVNDVSTEVLSMVRDAWDRGSSAASMSV